jgi:hypothetical protein
VRYGGAQLAEARAGDVTVLALGSDNSAAAPTGSGSLALYATDDKRNVSGAMRGMPAPCMPAQRCAPAYALVLYAWRAAAFARRWRARQRQIYSMGVVARQHQQARIGRALWRLAV